MRSKQFRKTVKLVDFIDKIKAMIGLKYLESEIFYTCSPFLEGGAEMLVDGESFFEVGDVI